MPKQELRHFHWEASTHKGGPKSISSCLTVNLLMFRLLKLTKWWSWNMQFWCLCYIFYKSQYCIYRSLF